MSRGRLYYLPSQRGVLRTSTRLQSLLDKSPSPLDVQEIEARLNLSRNAVNVAMQRLLKVGRVERVGLATYKSTKPPATVAPSRSVKAPTSFIPPIPLQRLMAGR